MTSIKLQVKDLAVVEKAETSFESGLNVVTGETGAGKSVLIGAINLLSGGRADHSMVRHGATQAVVTAEITIDEELCAWINGCLEEAGIDICEDNTLILRRTISTTGTGRCIINNCPSTVGMLSKIGSHLVDMHGPHDNQSLLSSEFQLSAVDEYGHCHEEREKYTRLWDERRKLEVEREDLSGKDYERELDVLKYQVDEICNAELDEEADGEQLYSDYNEISNASALIELANGANAALSDGETSAIDCIAAAIRCIKEMGHQAGDAAYVKEWESEADSISIQISELSKSIADRFSRLDVSPAALESLENRISLIERLKSKYGKTIAEIKEFGKKVSARYEELLSREERIAEMDRQIEKLGQEIKKVGSALSDKRLKAVKKLSDMVSKELSDLGIAAAAFSAEVTHEESRNGFDNIEFMFAPNKGEPKRSLKMIASSGEISRIMLALKTVLAEHDKIPILVFDEIDANVGGEIAHTVGKKLRKVSENHLVICITHLPQVAACGQCHFAVRKREEGERTVTEINELDKQQRVKEVSRMLGGEDLTSVVYSHAEELLKQAD